MKFGAVVITEVPAFVCTTCGDVWIDDPVAIKRGGFVAEVRRKHTMVGDQAVEPGGRVRSVFFGNERQGVTCDRAEYDE
jgi:hypothetical protein